MHKATIGVDLGGTRIKTVALDADGELLFQLYTPTNDGNGDNWKQTVKSSIEEMVTHLHITDFVAGISAPGIPDDALAPGQELPEPPSDEDVRRAEHALGVHGEEDDLPLEGQ